jgi:hypothetical protein
MRFTEGDVCFLKAGFEIFFSTLLTVEADRIEIGALLDS